MTSAPAALPPAGLAGLDPSWSRLERVRDADGVLRTWHLLDGGQAVAAATGAPPVGVVLAVHGNPTWSYLWRRVLPAAARAGWRVIAVDQLDMGFSERTGTRRRLARRVDDLGRLTDHLGVGTPLSAGGGLPVVTLGHDWGGIVSAGWAAAHAGALAGVVLLNTAVHQRDGDRVPPALRWVLAPGVLGAVTTATPGFLEATLATARRPLEPGVADGYRAPYRGAGRRGGIGAFVADVPATREHPSRAALDRVGDGLAALGAAGVPSLVVWGAADPVFRPQYLRDLRGRLPGGDVHRVAGAGHLVSEDGDAAGVVTRWLAELPTRPGWPWAAHRADPLPPPVSTGDPRARGTSTGDPRAHRMSAAASGTGAGADGRRPDRPMGAALVERARDTGPAVVQLRAGAPALTTSWAALAERVQHLAAGLATGGVRPGDRVSLLVPPGPDLTALFYACLRAGAVVVLADAGLGLRGLSRAVASADPSVVIGVDRALAAAAVLRWPGRRVLVPAAAGAARGSLAERAQRLLGAPERLDDVAARGRAALASFGADAVLPPEPAATDEAAVLFTSGSTGPAKGVVHTHASLRSLRDTLAATYGVGPGQALVAAFAPFALLGPACGATSSVPETDVTKPDTLTAPALARAVDAVEAAAVFASPAALARVVATAGDLDAAGRAALGRVRLLLSAGAPVGTELLAAAAALLPAADARTPYGMTEALPVTDVGLADLLAAGPGEGVLVGHPVAGAHLALAPLDAAGAATGALTTAAGVTGEVAVRAAHTKERYDQLWDVQRASLAGTPAEPGWHRTGDVGHLDADGRLWVEGRLAHVIATAAGPVTPVGPEQRVQALPAVARAALVGVGPAGTQQLVVVLEAVAGPGAAVHTDQGVLRPGPAPLALVDAVRAAAATPLPVASVLVVAALPTDVRHRSKVDRTAVAAWAEEVLAGRARAARGVPGAVVPRPAGDRARRRAARDRAHAAQARR